MYVSEESIFPRCFSSFPSLPFFWVALNIFLFISFFSQKKCILGLSSLLILKPLLCNCRCELPSSRPVFAILTTTIVPPGGWFCWCCVSFQSRHVHLPSPLLCILPSVAMAGALLEFGIYLCLSARNGKGMDKMWLYLFCFMLFSF